LKPKTNSFHISPDLTHYSRKNSQAKPRFRIWSGDQVEYDSAFAPRLITRYCRQHIGCPESAQFHNMGLEQRRLPDKIRITFELHLDSSLLIC